MTFLALLERKERFLIHVKPKSRKTEILGYNEQEDFFTVAVKAAPEDGKANEEIERHFSKLLKKEVRIKSGHTSKKKILIVS